VNKNRKEQTCGHGKAHSSWAPHAAILAGELTYIMFGGTILVHSKLTFYGIGNEDLHGEFQVNSAPHQKWTENAADFQFLCRPDPVNSSPPFMQANVGDMEDGNRAALLILNRLACHITLKDGEIPTYVCPVFNGEREAYLRSSLSPIAMPTSCLPRAG